MSFKKNYLPSVPCCLWLFFLHFIFCHFNCVRFKCKTLRGSFKWQLMTPNMRCSRIAVQWDCVSSSAPYRCNTVALQHQVEMFREVQKAQEYSLETASFPQSETQVGCFPLSRCERVGRHVTASLNSAKKRNKDAIPNEG